MRRITTNCRKMLFFFNSYLYSQACLHLLGIAKKSNIFLPLIYNLDFHNHLFWQPWALIVILSVIVGNCWCHFWTAPNTNFISTCKFCCWYVFIRQTVGDDWCGWRPAQDWREMEEGGHTIGDNSPHCQYLILAILALFCFIGLEWLFKKFHSKHTVSRQIHHLT